MTQSFIYLVAKLDKSRIVNIAGLFLVLLFMSVLLLRGVGNVSVSYPDAARLLMDGIFILDFLKDLPLTHIYQYTIEYYGQYPALSIGYRPPFFPLIEAIFNSIFGIEMWSSRLALLAFAVFGVSCWFDLLRRNYDTNIAICASLLLVSSPFFATWGWYTLTELPVLSMMMASAYFFFRYTETDKPVFLYTFAFLFCMSAWTKQTAAFQTIWYFLFILYKGQLLVYLRRKETWISIVMILVLVIPLILITIWLGEVNLAQSIGPEDSPFSSVSRLSWGNLTWIFYILVESQITTPIWILCIVGAVLVVFKRDQKFVFFGLLIVSVYIFFTYILIKSPRYTIFWVPAYTLLAVLPLYYFKKSKTFVVFSWIVVIAISIFQMNKTFQEPLKFATGYDEAAQYVLKHCGESPTVLFDGYNNGYFTYFMRALDPQKSMFVLRGDKLLSSSSVFSDHNLEVHAFSEVDIKKIIDEFGVSCIVVESEDISGIEIHEIFRDYLASGPFKLMRDIIIDSNRSELQDQTLQIYRYLEFRPATAEYLSIKLPIVGKNLKIPYRNKEVISQTNP